MSRRAALSVGAANFLGRVTGMARDILFAAIFGAGMVSDAFNAAFRVPQLLRELLAEGSLQNVVVPSLAHEQQKGGPEAAWKLANAFFGLLLAVLGGVTLIFIAFAPFWVRVVANGFVSDAEKFALTTSLTRWLAPFLAGLSISAMFAGMLNIRGRFFLPAMAQNVLNGLVIVACLAVGPFERATGLPGIVGVALATTLSGFVQVGLCLPALRAEGYHFRPSFAGHPALRGMLATLGPAFIGISVVQANVLIESQWASTFGDGAVTWLYQSFRLVQLPLTLFSSSIAVALLAAVSAHHARGEKEQLAHEVSGALRNNAFLVLPTAVALYVLAEPLVALFYERGAFTHEDTVATAAMLEMYGVACFGICLNRIVVPVFYAMGRPRLPMWAGIGTLAAKIPVILVLTRGFGMGAPALPLSHAITVSGECVLLVWGLREALRGRGLVSAHLRMGLAAVVLGGVAWALRDRMNVVFVCALAGGAYLVAARALGVFELRALLPRPKGLPPFVPPETRAALEELARDGARVEGDRIVGRSGAWRPVARGGAIELQADGEGGGALDRVGVEAIIRPQPPPPRMAGIVVGRAAWHAEGDQLVAGPCPGPRIPV